jgi:hypothetical protein
MRLPSPDASHERYATVLTGWPVVEHHNPATIQAPLSYSTSISAPPIVQIEDDRLSRSQIDSPTSCSPGRVVGEANEIRAGTTAARLSRRADGKADGAASPWVERFRRAIVPWPSSER